MITKGRKFFTEYSIRGLETIIKAENELNFVFC